LKSTIFNTKQVTKVDFVTSVLWEKYEKKEREALL